MKRSIVVVIALLAAVTAFSDATYRLFSSGKAVGTSEIVITPRGAGFLLKTETKFSEGSVNKTIKELSTLESEWIPTDYTLSITGSEGESRASATFKGGTAALKGKAGTSPIEASIEYRNALTPFLEDVSLCGIISLLHRADLSGVGSRGEFEVMLPLEGVSAKVTLTAVELEKEYLKIDGAREGGWSWSAYWDPARKQLGRLTVAGQFEAEIVQAEKAGEVEAKPQGYHPLSKDNLADGDLMGRVASIKNLKAGLAFNLSPEDFERLYLNHFSQEFAGEVLSDKIMGFVEVKNIGHKVTNTPNWPLFYPLKGYDEVYLLPERGVDSDNPAIMERAANTVKPAKTLWDAARAINLWVHRNIEYDASTGGALETFNSQKGDSRAKALLCTALCRAAGIPARVVSGVIWADGPIDHAWVEVYLDEKAGWGPIDPTLGEADKINAGHISLWIGSQFPPVTAGNLLLENVVLE